jgi:hypothetical protein
MDEAYRLIFSFDGEGFKLESTERVAMRVPPGTAPPRAAAGFAPTAAPAGLVGHFVELRDADGAALYQRPIAAPEALRLEYPTGDPERPLARAETAAPAMMSVLVPAREAGRSVALVEAAPTRAGARGMSLTGEAAPARRDLISVELPAAGETGDGR